MGELYTLCSAILNLAGSKKLRPKDNINNPAAKYIDRLKAVSKLITLAFKLLPEIIEEISEFLDDVALEICLQLLGITLESCSLDRSTKHFLTP
jgi:hypothetical protein